MTIPKGPRARAPHATTPEALATTYKNIRDKVTTNGSLPKPPPTLTEFSDAVDSFDAAVTKAKSRNPADIADRNAKAIKAEQQIGHIVDFTQGVADTLPNRADAIAVIVSTGLEVRKQSSYRKPELTVKYTSIPGQVLLAARAVPGAGAYFWEYSVDQGRTWLTIPESRRGETTFGGLTPGQLVQFRFRALTDDGKTDYSTVVSLIIH